MRLEKIELSGFKSYDESLHELELGDITVIERDASRKSSIIKRLDAKSLEGWLEEILCLNCGKRTSLGGNRDVFERAYR